MPKKKLTFEQLTKRMTGLKLLALDVDGVLTDDRIFFGPDGFEMKPFSISDGFYMVLARRTGLEIAVISGRYSPATTSRMKDLGVPHILQEQKDKRLQIKPLLEKLGLDLSQVAFMGNELLDIGLAREVGLSLAVADAAPELLEIVDYVTAARGGHGAVREILKAYFKGNKIEPLDYVI